MNGLTVVEEYIITAGKIRFFEGNWGMTQKRVDEIILHTIRGLRKYCKRDNRIGICEKDGDIYVAIIARDLPGYAADYLIGFTNEED